MRDGCVVEGADDDLGTEPAEPIVAPAGPLWVDALTGRAYPPRAPRRSRRHGVRRVGAAVMSKLASESMSRRLRTVETLLGRPSAARECGECRQRPARPAGAPGPAGGRAPGRRRDRRARHRDRVPRRRSRPGPVGAFATVAVLAGLAAGWSAQARRSSTGVLVAAASVDGGRGIAVLLGLLTLLLLLGRLPAGAERRVVGPAAAAVVVAAACAGPFARRAARRTRAVMHAVRRSRTSCSPTSPRTPAAAARSTTCCAPSPSRCAATGSCPGWRSGPRLDDPTAAPSSTWEGRADPGLRRTLVVPSAAGPRNRPRPAPLDPAELGMLRRAGVAGPGWLRLWVPRLLDGHENAGPLADRQLRFAPALHGGSVLALVVIERPRDALPFSTADDRALAEVARRLAIVLRNRSLDEALQATLADLRAGERGPAGVPPPAGDHRGRRAQADRARPARRRPAAPRRARGRHPAGPRQPRPAASVRGRRAARRARPRRPRVDRLAARPGARDLPAAAARRRPGGGAAGRGEAQPARRHGRRRGRWAAIPEQVEAAVYFCCLEALANAGKHAGGERDGHAAGRAGELRFEVADTGPGFDPRTPPRARACRTWRTGSGHWAARSRGARRRATARSSSAARRYRASPRCAGRCRWGTR